jgi:molybdopterin synthase catalytic subunit
MIDTWIQEIKKSADPRELGMILIHNGVVRATSKEGQPVRKMNLSFSPKKLETLLKEFRDREGILDLRVWINHGELAVGDDIMLLAVAGRFRSDIMPVFQELLSRIKNDIVKEEEDE